MRLNTDRVVSLSAMLVGLGSLFIIVYQTALLREQQTASALPYLMMGIQSNDARSYLFARNTGVGPALIEDVVVRYQGREMRQDPYDFFVTARPEVATAGGMRVGIDKLIPGRLVPAGEWVNMFGADGDGSRAMEAALLALFDIAEAPQSWYDNIGVKRSGPDKAIIEVTYRSVYGDRWVVSSDSLVPKEL
jgi:hypothetical protein